MTFTTEIIGPITVLRSPSSERHYLNDELHRDNDLPAVIIYNNKDEVLKQVWYKNGLKHRDIGPAVITKDTTEYWKEGERTINPFVK